MSKALLLSLILSLLLVACLPEPQPEPIKEEYNQAHGISEVYLIDGTRCVTIFQNGITCDFNGIKHPGRYKGNNEHS